MLRMRDIVDAMSYKGEVDETTKGIIKQLEAISFKSDYHKEAKAILNPLTVNQIHKVLEAESFKPSTKMTKSELIEEAYFWLVRLRCDRDTLGDIAAKTYKD